MDNQLTIFDYINQKQINDTPLSLIAEIIGNKIGVKLTYDNYLEEYSGIVNKTKIYVEKSEYKESGLKFIGCGWQNSKCGAGKPCDSIEESIQWFLTAKNAKFTL